ncbi:MAG: hypothetical protein M1832_004958 [Thelocarpon impressellum]|nr:MAG: hypothetical protein M1832_004958 [Thelocarpon impressellum]
MAAGEPDQAPRAVTVSLHELEAGTVPFGALEEAFGPASLGIILVRDLPERFAGLRHRLLSYASYLAALPEAELQKLEAPEAKWLVGWSRGRETLKSGVYDTRKGSYYVNCAFYTDPSLSSAPGHPSLPEYTAPNVWPAEKLLPAFRETFEELCILVIDAAVLVARACDMYGEREIEGYRPGTLETMVVGSTTTKARLLHYFPSPPLTTTSTATATNGAEAGSEDDWCATHLDHGCLTGLTSAMFVDEGASPPLLPPSPSSPLAPLAELSASPDPSAGLYIHSRASQTVKVSIPRDALAFQTGEALQLLTRGRFRAVPHFVRGARGAAVARNTLAVFTQPNLDAIVDEGRGLTFADFARGVVERNH